MVYSVHDRRVVLFNGRDTWVFDGNDWQQVQSAHSPPLRSGHAMVYDAANQRVILFGGSGEYYYRNGNRITERDDTWAFADGDWQQIVTAHAPSPRLGHAMAYDVANQRVILFGGDANSDRNDTWIFTGDDWEEVANATPPSSRYNHALAYDTRNHRIVVFAGEDVFSRQYDDTWTFINNTWRRIAAATSPPSRYRHAMVYDSDQQRFVLFGGTQDSIVYSDTWTLRL